MAADGPRREPTIVTIPGLGFTPRLWDRLDLSPWPVEHLEWIEPAPREPLRDYAVRIAAPLGRHAPSRLVLVGHSFGGVVAQEIAATLDVAHVVLVASLRQRAEAPLWLRLAAPLGLHRAFTRRTTLATFDFWGPLAGYAGAERRALFRAMVSTQSDSCLQWSLATLSRWPGPPTPQRPTPVSRVHGTRDRTLPLRRIPRDGIRIVDGGTHLLPFDAPDIVGDVIREAIST